MYRCEFCREIIEEPEQRQICYEDEYGVSSLFPDKHYGYVSVCPGCGAEEIEDYYEEEEE